MLQGRIVQLSRVCFIFLDHFEVPITVVNGYSVNRLTGPEGRTGLETDGPVKPQNNTLRYLAITAHVYKFQFMNIAPPQIFSLAMVIRRVCGRRRRPTASYVRPAALR